MCRAQDPNGQDLQTETWLSSSSPEAAAAEEEREGREASEEFDIHRRNRPHDPLHVDLNSLPDITLPEMDFRDTSFFRHYDSEGRGYELPSPESINALSEGRGARMFKIDDPPMVVKISCIDNVKMEEIQTMRALRRIYFQEEVPVPEVFGWRTHAGQIFIYMSLAKGQKLQTVWPDLRDEDKERIQADLSRLVLNLRRIRRQDHPQQIASINGGPVTDDFFRPDYIKGPFPNPEAFHDWMYAAASHQRPSPSRPLHFPEQYRRLRNMLADDTPVYFSHGALVPFNIMIAGSPGTYHLSGVVNWEEAGWYPEHWENSKMFAGCCGILEWMDEEKGAWADGVVPCNEDARLAIAEYMMWRTGGT